MFKLLIHSVFVAVLSCNSKIDSNKSYEKSESVPAAISVESKNSDQLVLEKFKDEGADQKKEDKKEMNAKAQQGREISFEDYHHFQFPVTDKDFWLINNQKEMDALFAIVHSRSKTNRLSPIPTVEGNTSYIVLKPGLKKENDAQIKKIHIQNTTLYVDVEEYNNPQWDKNSRKTPHIFLKLKEKININKVIFN